MIKKSTYWGKFQRVVVGGTRNVQYGMGFWAQTEPKGSRALGVKILTVIMD